MVYADRYDRIGETVQPHPVIDYQQGAVRDDFDFGSLWLVRRDGMHRFLEQTRLEGLKYAAPYALRLFLSTSGTITHLRELLYEEEKADLRKSGEKQFDYVDPRNHAVQKEKEIICTEHLHRIGAWLAADEYEEFPTDEPNLFPVEVSVIIPVRNREKTIVDAIESALAQQADFTFNVIVIDNYSTDGTPSRLSRYRNHPQVCVMTPPARDLGIGGCWDWAIRSTCCGRYAVQLDSDDLYSSPQTLSRIVTAFRKEGAAMVIGTYRMVDFDLNTLPPGLIDHKEWTPENGLDIRKVRVPLGVIGIIYEARPNVTADAFGLCFKTGNPVVLRGGSDAVHSNLAIVEVLQKALTDCGCPASAIQLLEDTSRETAAAFMKLNRYIDVLIPRGSAGLIATVVNNSTIPVIETGSGNCHIYVDEDADLQMAADIVYNAKTQRIGVCNACESLVVHRKVKDAFLPMLARKLSEKQVELRGDEAAREAVPSMKEASAEDWGTEYLDYILSVKTVDSLDEAIAHINRYNTGHSEAIITENKEHAEKFLQEVDAAAVYVNASTRFTDGFEFGFGAEIGISTQKLHARGPMGLEALTSYKYEIYGNGQVRG